MKLRNILVLFALLTASCGGDEPAPEVPAPLKALLIAPAQNEACTTGTIISDTQSGVVLKWNASEHANSYEVTVKNLLTGTSTTQPSTQTELTVTLLRNTPYSWFVVSKSTATTITTQSDTWRFYNAGPGAITFAPAPAGILSPAMGQNIAATSGKVKLEWKGEDVENDITGYDVYFGTSTAPPLLKSNITDSFLADVDVTPGTVYYWRVTTKDSKGNSSDSGIFQFKVN